MSSPDRDAAEAEVGDEAAADEAADEVVDEPAPKKAAPGTKKIQGIKSRIAAAEVRYEKNIGFIAKVQAKISAGTTRARGVLVEQSGEALALDEFFADTNEVTKLHGLIWNVYTHYSSQGGGSSRAW